MKKVMTENDKLNKVIGLFKEIRELFPEGGCSLNIHKVDIKAIDRKIWKIKAVFNNDTLRTYLVAENDLEDEYFGIDLFGKDN